MDICKACGKELVDGDSIIIVIEASIFNDGETEYGNTERYHSACVTIDW